MKPIEPAQLAALFQKPVAAPAVPSGAAGFAEALKGALDGVSRAQGRAADLALRFQQNDPAVSLERTMIAMSQANVSFQALVQTRNRLVQAYQDIMNMQV
jgi:flagellar hook-basal body complex protein FliE